MPEAVPPQNAATSPIATADAGFLVLLQLLTETRMAQGLDPDGSATSGAAMRALGHWRQVGGLAQAPGTPFDPGAAPAIADLRALIDRNEPLIARLACAAVMRPT